MQTPIEVPDPGPAHPRAAATDRAARGSAAPAGTPVSPGRRRYRQVLGWSFALFGSVRLLGYLPTVFAIWHSRDASQHSLATWLTWLGANLTMALYLHEHDPGRSSKAVWISVGNAVMCAATSVLILVFR